MTAPRATGQRTRVNGHAMLKSATLIIEGGFTVAQGRCECGAVSDMRNVLSVARWNRFITKWHRQHKAEVAGRKS